MKKQVFLICLALLIGNNGATKRIYIPSTQFSDQQTALIMNGLPNQPMRVFKINNSYDSVLLRTNSGKIKADASDLVLQTFIRRLYSTVTDSLSMGVGIAAPQVGILKRIIWVQRFDKPDLPFEVYLNPKIVKYSKEKQICKEGCLSIPGRSDTLSTRSKKIRIVHHSMDGKRHRESVEGFTAVIFQHEIDHLNGILYLDHLEEERKDRGN